MTDHDEFLNEFRTTPRREFAERLYAKLSDERVEQSMFTKLNPLARRAVLVLAAMVLMFGAVLALSPAARATAQSWITEFTMGGMIFSEVQDGIALTQQPLEEEIPPPVVDYMTVAEAQEIYPFKFPTWSPEEYGFTDGSVRVMVWEGDYEETLIWITWDRWEPYYSTINLMINDDAQYGEWIGESGDAHEVGFNGLTGVVFKGGWDGYTNLYAHPGVLTLMWVEDGLKYRLQFLTKDGVTEEQLIQMASSME